MSAWYYAKDGRQYGPVAVDEIVRLLGTGTLRRTDLVWNETLRDWKPAGDLPELSPPPAIPPPPPEVRVPQKAYAADPYRPPASNWQEMQVRDSPLAEIVPGSDPLDISACLSRAWELTKRHFGLLFLVGFVYVLLSALGGALTGFVDEFVSGPRRNPEEFRAFELIATILQQVFDVFLMLGLARIGLNVVSGKHAQLEMLFGGGRQLLPAVGASILYYAMVAIGLLLLVVPGIYLAIRFGHYLNAIVDKDLGVIESLKYSSRLTEGNRLNLFGLAILSILMVIAGILAFLVGLLAALPVVFLANFVAYRWLQYGRGSLRP